ncbi:two-component system, OmpR family, response regulator [Glycomyces sambucus]|uniref:Two-component system, OmpR family, response regulator n=3 Tax=Glycomyces TaxID=58113 RepID=A0A1G9L978_9ACTN|nr:two-component system, OmpR family, response regulator [Glycomyces sambucus]
MSMRPVTAGAEAGRDRPRRLGTPGGRAYASESLATCGAPADAPVRPDREDEAMPLSTSQPSAETEATLLVVEDDENICELLATSLRYAGFAVHAVGSGDEALRSVARHRPDLVVLDVNLPDFDGFEVVRRMRSGSDHTPVLFLTARDDTADTVTGLSVGGDDYITKPFALEEVVARIRAVLRRSSGELPRPSRLQYADLELDEETHEVWRAGKAVQLSPTEFKLLRYFMINAGRVLSKAQILDHVWRYDFRGDDGIVESYVSYLRRKIDTGEPKLIQTLRGIGYVLREQHR